MTLGDFEITALNEGVIDYSVKTLIGATPDQIKAGLAEAHLTDPAGMSFNSFLIRTHSKLILIDTGTGGKLDDNPGFHGAGQLMANLRATGYRPEDIDEIYITHMGPDHVGGLTSGTERAFPKAVVRIAQREIDAFLNPPDTLKTNFWVEFRFALFAPCIRAQRLQTFTEDITLSPGIRALATAEHTPGHTSFVVESKGQTLIVMGDLVHWGAVQFPFPAAYTSFDSNPKPATAERIRIFQMAADHHSLVAGAHLTFPGIGRIRASAGRYFWLPINLTSPIVGRDSEGPLPHGRGHVPAPGSRWIVHSAGSITARGRQTDQHVLNQRSSSDSFPAAGLRSGGSPL